MFQHLPEEAGGEAHHVVEGAAHLADTDAADPLLHTVGAGFVEGLVGVDIVLYHLVAQGFEDDVGGAVVGELLLRRGHRQPAVHRMGVAGEHPQHPLGVLLVFRLPDNLPVHHHDGVAGDEDGVGRVLRHVDGRKF